MNINGEEKTASILETKVTTDVLSFDLDISNFGDALVNITNPYGFKDVKYTLLIGFYNMSGKLIGVTNAVKYSGDSNVHTYTYDDVPEGTVYAKGYLWEDTNSVVPLAPVGSLDIASRTANRGVLTMSIAPGKDETERNFAWYDVLNMGGAKIQIAEKNTGTVSDFNADNARTFQGTCGNIDVAKYNGTPLNESKPNTLFNYEGEYSWAKATVTGLKKGQAYVYRVGDKFGWCKDIYEFKTDAAPEDGFDFLLFADEHSKKITWNDAMINTTTKAFDYIDDPSLILALGDNVDLPWEETAYTEYFKRPYTKSIPIASVPGPTHDMLISPKSASAFGYHFNMPNQSETSGYITDVCGNYWFTYGDVLFIGLTNNWKSTVSTNAAFVKEAVDANPNAKWRILYAHMPFGSDGSGDPTTGFFTTQYGDFVADNGIDIALFGHLHHYYRTYPMVGGEVVSTVNANEVTDPEGPVYISLNTAGARANKTTEAPYKAFADTTAVYGLYQSVDYHTYFSTAKVVTTDEECSLEIKTYRNTCQGGGSTILSTELLDTYKINKTK